MKSKVRMISTMVPSYTGNKHHKLRTLNKTDGNKPMVFSGISFRVSFRGSGRGHLPPLGFGLPPPWICWDFYFTHKSIQAFNDTINGEFCLCRKSPRFHQIASNKRSKNKISPGSMPPNPLVCPMLSTQIRTWAKSWKKPWPCTMVTLKVWGHSKNALCCMYLTDKKKKSDGNWITTNGVSATMQM